MRWVALCLYGLLLGGGPILGKETICLNMIVKDEQDVIVRALASVKPLIDYWVIVDTGSSDGTQELIRNYMADLPGELHERPWKNFGFNRNEALELAQGKGDYLLLIDADDFLVYQEGFRLTGLDQEAYWMEHRTNQYSYWRPQLIRASLPWRYVGVTHEYLTCDYPTDRYLLQEVTYHLGAGGACSKEPKAKFIRNIELFEEERRQGPLSDRSIFYLAESYRDAGECRKAIASYQERVDRGGWEEEVFWSLLQIAQLREHLGDRFDDVVAAYYKAHYFRPHRKEPVYFLACLFNRVGAYQMAYALLKSADLIPLPPKGDILFKLDWIDSYGLLFELSLASYYLGYHQESWEVCEQILQVDNLPSSYRSQAQINGYHALKQLQLQRVEEVKMASP